MLTFKQFIEKARSVVSRQAFAKGNPQRLDEHKLYKNFPGEKTSYRLDACNTSTMTQRHAHIFAMPDGEGRQLYAVNVDGSGHDGSSGIEISGSHAEFLRRKGFAVPVTNILEQLDPARLNEGRYSLILLAED